MGSFSIIKKGFLICIFIFLAISCENAYEKASKKSATKLLTELKSEGYSIESLAVSLHCNEEDILFVLQRGEEAISSAGKRNLVSLYCFCKKHKKLMNCTISSSYSFVSKKNDIIYATKEQRKKLELSANNLYVEKVQNTVKSLLENKRKRFIDKEFSFVADYKNMWGAVFYKEEKRREWNRAISKIFDVTELKDSLYLLGKEYQREVNLLRKTNKDSLITENKNLLLNLNIPNIYIEDLNLSTIFIKRLQLEIAQEATEGLLWWLTGLILLNILGITLSGWAKTLIPLVISILLGILFFWIKSNNLEDKVNLQIKENLKNYYNSIDLNLKQKLNTNTYLYYEENNN